VVFVFAEEFFGLRADHAATGSKLLPVSIATAGGLNTPTGEHLVHASAVPDHRACPGPQAAGTET